MRPQSKKSGLVVDPELPFLACSPDGLIGDDAVIEIKTSVKSGNLIPIEACKAKLIDFCEFDDIRQTMSLKKTHSYYYQVQGLLLITKRILCYFLVATQAGIFVERITR